MLKTSQTNLTILIFAVVSLLAAQPAYKLDTQGGRVPSKMANGFALKPNAENNNLFDQLFDDEIVETGYSYRNSYSRDNRSVDDTLYYDLPWGAYFSMYPGDVMVTAFQVSADATLKGVSVPVYRWGTGEELTVSVHALSYPYGSDGVMYDQGLVNGSAWLAGYDDDGDGLMELEGTTWNSADGVCGSQTMIGNAQDPLGSTAASSGPPNTPTMGLLWPDGTTAATLNPTDNPGIENGGGDNWISFTDYGSEVNVLQGDWIGVVVHYTGTGGDSTDWGIGFYYAAYDGISPWRSFKFYEDACDGTGGESGWYYRSYTFNYQLAAELTGDRGPVYEEIDVLNNTSSTANQSISASVTDDNPSGGSAGVSAVTLSYKFDDLTSTIYTVDMTMTSGDAEDGTWAGDIPGQSLGTKIYWWLTAEDINENTTASTIYSYYIMSDGLVVVPGDLPTIQQAIDFSNDGDTVLVSAGTYVENINFSGKNISVIGADKETTIIDGNQNGSVVLFGNDETNAALLTNFTIRNGTGTPDPTQPNNPNASMLGGGIFMWNGGGPTLRNLIIENNQSDNGGGFFNFGGSTICKDLIIRNNNGFNGGSALIIKGNNTQIENALIVNNGWQSNTEGGVINIQSDGILNNITLANNNGRPLWTPYHGPTFVMMNSIIDYPENGGQPCYLEPQWENASYSFINCQIKGGMTLENFYDDPEYELTLVTENIYTLDPAFADTSNGDYSLSNHSPMIGAGASSITIGGITYDVPTTDVLGVDRPSPSGTNPDIGAYENLLGIPQYRMSVDSVYFVHGDTALVSIRNLSFSPSLNSIDLKIAGFQGKLGFVDLVTDSSTIFGSLGWITQYNNTDTLLITASASANPVDSSGVLFALKLAVPDTLSSQFIPINITDFTGNEDYTDFSVTAGGVQSVWGPTANFISDTTTGYLPLVISFTDTSEIGTYPINQWAWDFGDDSTATGTNVQHTYTQEGQYTVTLIVTDEFGLSDTLTMVDYIDALHPIYPVAGFSASVTSGDYPLNVTFTDTSNMGTYTINSWLWDFGNDSTGSGSNVSMTYQRPGQFDVTLTITDEYDLSDTLIASSIIQVDTTYGDVDWNALVQSFDGSLILKDLVEIIELDTLQRIVGDVSGDSSLSTLDASLILQYVVGLITELPYDPGTQFLAMGDLSMEDYGVAPGSVVAVPINISNGSNIYGFEAVLEFDPAVLEFDTLLLSEAMANYLIIINPLEEGVVKVAASGSNVDDNEGVFATLYFNVSNDFTDETVIQVNNLRWNEDEVVVNAAQTTLSYALGIGEELLPDVFALHQNYPNPFNPVTTLRYDLPENSLVNIIIYDLLGREVKSLINQTQDAGFKSIIWNATNNYGKPVSAGVYLYQIQAGEFVQTKKMVLLK